jgi:hypothetical protein
LGTLINIKNRSEDGTWKADRPKLRWADGVAQDVKNLGINNWKKAAQDKRRWRRHLADAKT